MERFKKPTDDELLDFAMMFNGGEIDKKKLIIMIGFTRMVIDRLHDNGDILRPSKQELKDEEEADHYRNMFDSPSELRE